MVLLLSLAGGYFLVGLLFVGCLAEDGEEVLNELGCAWLLVLFWPLYLPVLAGDFAAWLRK